MTKNRPNPESDAPPRWLIALTDRVQARLDSITARRPPPEAPTRSSTADQDRRASFERRWGLLYAPIVILLVVWLLVVSLWDKL